MRYSGAMTSEHETRVTARHVADRAGVTVSTVSKAMSGRGTVRRETRERILQIAQELGYTSAQQSARAAEPTTIGVIISDRFGRLTVPLLLGAIEELSERGIALLLFDGRGDPIREQHFVETLRERRADGILVAGAGLYPRPPIRGGTPVPTVYALSWSTSPDDTSVVSDDASGARLAAEHLVATGRRRIAFVSGPRADTASQVRLASTTAVLEENGLELAAEPIFGSWSEHWGRQAAHQLLRSGADIDGIVCGSDQVARGVLDALRDAGVEVPSQIAVTGFDNWGVVTSAARPTLTSVEMNLHEVGRRAVELLIERIAAPASPPQLVQIECELVLRESSALG